MSIQNVKLKWTDWCLQYIRWIEKVCWLLALSGFLVACLSSWRWHLLAERNALFQQPERLITLPGQSPDARWAYARGYALQQDETQASAEQALRQFYLPENSQDRQLRAYAKFAIGNLYFDWAMSHYAVERGGAHQQQVAMIALAREAYKDALRLYPGFAEARFNLELMDRHSPEKRTQGWQSETDGVTLKPFKRNGTAMMRDNQRRGLP